MTLKIKLSRFGSKKKTFYRIRIANSKSPRDGKFIDNVGTYNPLIKEKKKKIILKHKILNQWLKKGAQPTNTIKRILHDNQYINYQSNKVIFKRKNIKNKNLKKVKNISPCDKL